MTIRQATEIIKQIQDRQTKDGIRVTFFLSESVYKEFKKICGETAVSAVVNEWMKDAVNYTKNQKKKKS